MFLIALSSRIMSTLTVSVLILVLTMVLTVPATGETEIGGGEKTKAWITLGVTSKATTEQPTPTLSMVEKVEDPEDDQPRGDNSRKTKPDTDYTVDTEKGSGGVRNVIATAYFVMVTGLVL